MGKDIVSTEILLEQIIEGIKNVKGREIVNIDLSKLEHSICRHFVVCHGDSNTQVSAIADSVERRLKDRLSVRAYRKEGYENSQWILMDYGHILVHIFQKPYRDFYRLEELWGDGKLSRIPCEV